MMILGCDTRCRWSAFNSLDKLRVSLKVDALAIIGQIDGVDAGELSFKEHLNFSATLFEVGGNVRQT